MSPTEPGLEQNINKELLTQHLKHGVKEIFSTMVGMDDLMHLPVVPRNLAEEFDDCVSSLVGLAGTYNGLVSLHMPGNLALRSASSMLGMDVQEFNEDVSDALGEIANMIAGSCKMHLSRGGLDVQLSTPSVVNGMDFLNSLDNSPDQIIVHFATDDESFIVAITLHD